jgi:hypothetical protein
MPIIASRESEHEFENPPEDTYIAVCYRVIDLGTQQVEWNGESKRQHKIIIGWELNAPMADGRPFTINKRYTLSLHEKATLCQHLEAWRGRAFTEAEAKGFDIGNVIGIPCMMQIVHNDVKGKTYANINAIMKYKGDVPALVNEKMYFSLDEFEPDKYARLSKNIRETIAESPEYIEIMKKTSGKKEPLPQDLDAPPVNHPINDEIPFIWALTGMSSLGMLAMKLLDSVPYIYA